VAGRRLAARLARGLALAVLLAVVGLVGLLALLWREHGTPIALPAPTGPFAVGRTAYTWVDDSETDELAPSPGTKREVVVWIWYPAEVTDSGAPVEYLPAAWRRALAESSGVLMSRFLTRDPAVVRAHARSDPAVSSEESPYPVVIMRAGGGALTTDFTTLAEDLASHGYVVVGFDAPYRTFVVVLPDGRVVARPPEDNPENLGAGEASRLIDRLLPMWTRDTSFVVGRLERLDAAGPSGRFTGRLDLGRLGMLGHSFGGATALQFCHDDPRCRAGIDLDGAPRGSVVRDGPTQPFMFVLSDHSRELSDPSSQRILADIRSIYARLPNGRLMVTLRGANHFSFSDEILLKSHYVVGLARLLGFGRLEGRRGLAITAEYVHTFFDVYLKGAPVDRLTSLSRRYPEVDVEQP
jgi:pimeloyl-ACP methyl ester carboxylesterase